MSFVGKNANGNRSTGAESRSSTSCEIVHHQRLNPALAGRESSTGPQRLLAPSSRVPPQDDAPQRLPQIVPRKQLSKSLVGNVADDVAKAPMPPPAPPPPLTSARTVSNFSENNRSIYEMKNLTGGQNYSSYLRPSLGLQFFN